MNLPELYQAIDNHISGWNPVLVLRDNKPPKNLGEKEYILVRVDGGEGFISRRTGMLSVRGNYVRHPVFLTFRVFTPINEGTDRSAQLCQEIEDHWFYPVPELDKHLTLDTVSINRISESKPHYIQTVDIGGFRDERR